MATLSKSRENLVEMGALVPAYPQGDTVPMIPPLGLIPVGSKAVNLDKSVINVAEIIRHTENFSNFVFSDRHSECLCIWVIAIPNLQKLSLFS